MVDPRITSLARTLVNYSCAAREGERILIEAIDVPHEITCECIRLARAAGASPFVALKSNQVNRALMMTGTEDQWQRTADLERLCMEQVHCYIAIRGYPNTSELSDVPSDSQRLYESTVGKRVHNEVRVKKTRWVVLRWPDPSMAQSAGMSTEAFEDFYFEVCTMDYARLEAALQPLRRRMEQTDRVRLHGPGDTDLTFSIRGIPAVPCSGHYNIPDGEIYTAPVRDSVNGTITFNAPTSFRGQRHEGVRLRFAEGKIIEATSSAEKKLNEVLDADAGARYIGEFSIGVNPFITRPMNDALFDEKISGSIHLTPGQAYETAFNGNVSQIHWDMVLLQTREAGGGEIYFDDELIRKDGLFVASDLACLNPDELTTARAPVKCVEISK